jgi:hypothetical protein
VANDRLTLNTHQSRVTAATTTSLTTSVPAATGSGRFTILTPAGQAISTADFFVAPPPFVAADVEFTDRVSTGSTKVVTISTATKIGLVTLDGTAGQRVSLTATGTTISSATMAVLHPDGTTLKSTGIFSGLTGFLDVTTLPVTGTYTVLVDPLSNSTGSTTLTPYDVPADVTGAITAGGSAVTVSMATPGQNARLTFSGTSSHRVSLKAVSTSFSSATVAVLNPDGTTLASITAYSGLTGFLDVTTLPSTGTYTVLIDPTTTSVGSTTVTLYDVPADVTGSITPGGSAVTVSPATPGQNARLTFSGTSGQRISLTATSTTINVSTLTVLNPDGTTLVSAAIFSGGGGFFDGTTLPATGTYTVVVDPWNEATGSTTLTLYAFSDVASTVTIGGSAVTTTLGSPGQNGTLTFSGTASQQVTVHITSNTVSVVTVTLRKPDGTTLTSSMGFSASFNLSTQTLPTTGTYTIAIDPYSTYTGSLATGVTSP